MRGTGTAGRPADVAGATRAGHAGDKDQRRAEPARIAELPAEDRRGGIPAQAGDAEREISLVKHGSSFRPRRRLRPRSPLESALRPSSYWPSAAIQTRPDTGRPRMAQAPEATA